MKLAILLLALLLVMGCKDRIRFEGHMTISGKEQSGNLVLYKIKRSSKNWSDQTFWHNEYLYAPNSFGKIGDLIIATNNAIIASPSEIK